MDADRIVALVTGLVTTWGLRVVGALAVLLIGLFVARLLRRAAVNGLRKSHVDDTLAPFFGGIAYYLTLVFVAVAVLHLFGLQTTSFVAVIGAAGLAIGLALQGALSSFAAGVMLLLFRPFKLGDYVNVGGEKGTVKDLSLFTTTLSTPDNVRVTVPNAKVWGDTIHNFNGYDTRRVDLVVGVSYDDDLGLAMETIRSVVTADDRVLAEPPLQVAVSEMGASSVDLVVRPWCAAADYWPLRFDLTRRLKEELEGAGCSIPYPQRDVHLFQHPVSEEANA